MCGLGSPGLGLRVGCEGGARDEDEGEGGDDVYSVLLTDQVQEKRVVC